MNTKHTIKENQGPGGEQSTQYLDIISFYLNMCSVANYSRQALSVACILGERSWEVWGKYFDICVSPQNLSRNVLIGLTLHLEFVHLLFMLKLPRKNLRRQRRKKKEVKAKKQKKPKKLRRRKKKMKVLGRNKPLRRKIEPPFLNYSRNNSPEIRSIPSPTNQLSCRYYMN